MRAILVSIMIAALVVVGWAVSRPPARPEINAELVGVQATDSTEGFAQALEPRKFEFPADHGPHPGYQTEWWYYTGNLDTDASRHFGYQLTFFRRALTPTAPERASDWGSNQVYMAHFALTDVASGRFHNFERFSRGAVGLAGATGNPYHVWLESWSAEETEAGGNALAHPSPKSLVRGQGPGEQARWMRLLAAEGDVKIDLALRPTKPPALHGQAGLSQKSSTAGNASYYYSLTRIDSRGTITVGDHSYTVRGLSWMDHEFGTSFLAENHVGWDWFALQLDDGRELMYFQIRQDDGGSQPLSSGSLIETDGTVGRLSRDDVAIRVLDHWTSPKTGGTYPAGWHLSVPVAGLELDVQPYASDQELDVSYAYWEGAVRVTGTGPGGPVTGIGYVELTGYAGAMQGEF